MNLANITLPPGVDRISASDFRSLVFGQGATDVLASQPRPAASDVYVAFEHDEQVAFVQWLRLKKIRHNATPNGGHRASKTAKWLKAEGVAAGFPDITVWPEPGSGLPVLHIEMKRTIGGQPTSEQLKWMNYLNSLPGHVAAICEGADEAIRFVCNAWQIGE